MEAEQGSIQNSYLSFKLGKDIFAAHVSKVLNILELQDITHVPKSPEYLKGVTNLRGSVLPVIDTRVKFGMAKIKYTQSTCILVLDIKIDGESVSTGALVDSVHEVFEANNNQIQPPPSMGIKFNTQYIDGILRRNDHFIILLDLDKVFGNDEIIALRKTTDEIKEITDNNQKLKNS